jgi:hypothetical protein
MFTLCINKEHVAQLPTSTQMTPRPGFKTPSRFQRKIPGGRFDLLFGVVFGGTGAAARILGVSHTQIWRWRHSPDLPDWVAEILTDRVQKAVEQVHAAQDDLRRYRAQPPKPPRKLSGCCAGRYRRAKRMPRTPEEWAALG